MRNPFVAVFGYPAEDGIVNVASIPQRSPFRYPGGKTWLVPYIRMWLRRQGGEGKELFEVFAGGGIISLTAVFEQLVDRVTMVEIDADVAAVWQVIINGDAAWLAERIISFELTLATAKAAKP
jgi:DNA adenine methylase